MLTPKRIESNVAPKTIENLWNGNWYYNYDVQEKTVTVQSAEDEEPVEETRYSYIQVKMAGEPTYKKCVQHIIRQFITQDQEFDLINSYNKVTFNMLPEDEAKEADDEYVEYLNKIQEIKAKIKEDFQTLNNKQ